MLMPQVNSETAIPVAETARRAVEQPQKLEVRLRSLAWEGPDVVSLDLVRADRTSLPRFDAGAHVDLYLPGGVIRQYSLCSDPADCSHYRIAVRDVGGISSHFVHRKARPGELLTISTPRNNFPLIDADNYIFIAGGIGITPLMPMIWKASAKGRNWTLRYCHRLGQNAPFLPEIVNPAGEVVLHSTERGTRLDVEAELSAVRENTLVYCCGPESLMTAVEDATRHWPVDSVHFEWFSPRSNQFGSDTNRFEVVCEASGQTLQVPPDKTILTVLNEAGIDVPCSCQQGICGTCEVRVLAGEVDHRDSILSSAERAANATMMTCVSRARGPRLVLDI